MVQMSEYGKMGFDGGGDIRTQTLNVSSNGTYTAPLGKAYTPVNVNVPPGVSETWELTYDDDTTEEKLMVVAESPREPYVEMTYNEDMLFSTLKFHGHTSIPGYTFSSQALTSVELNDEVSRFEDEAFSGNYELSSINIPAGTTYIGDYAFAECPLSSTIDLPRIEFLQDHALSYIGNLESLTLGSQDNPAGMHLADGAVSNCESLKYVEIGSNVIEVGRAFCGCEVEAVWIRESCAIIGEVNAPQYALFAGGNSELVIYLEADELPVGFAEYWNRCGENGEVVASYNLGYKTRPW